LEAKTRRNMSDRKAELERKKQKLEMMRKERQEKERMKKMKEVCATGADCRTTSDLESFEFFIDSLALLVTSSKLSNAMCFTATLKK